ncbi:MAG: histidinol-phosphatase [Acidimicrobiales bacterium]
MLDYHLHLWPHTQRDVHAAVDQVAVYCEQAAAAGVVEVAITEHLFRFIQAVPVVGAFWEDDASSRSLKDSMAAYWDFHARADLDAYVETVLAAKRAGLPVVLGLEVDYYRGQMDRVASLLDDYPFDVLLGSVHWLGAWRFDDLDDAVSMGEWSVRDVDATWESYTLAMEEMAATGACDVLAHPDLVKVTGRRPDSPAEWWDRIAEAAATTGMAAELSSAGWRKPVGEQYPAQPLLVRLAARGVPLTTASDAHGFERVADRAHELRALLEAVGVDHLQAYRRRQPHSVPLSAPGAPGAPAVSEAPRAPGIGR